MCSSDSLTVTIPQKKNSSLAIGLAVKFLIDHNSHLDLTK